MSATRRRRRVTALLASPPAVRAVCHLLRDRMPDVIPSSEKGLVRLLYTVRHVERRPATDTRPGRPPQWPREKLVEAASQLRSLLERETQERVSVNSFIGQYLPLLSFPSGVTNALASGRINLQEAAQLARLPPTPQLLRARRKRQALRVAHFPPRRPVLTDASALPGQRTARRIGRVRHQRRAGVRRLDGR